MITRMDDIIFLNPKDLNGDYISVPNEPASDPNYVKHIVCDGARFHVIYWETTGKKCSCENCIINKEK